ncbi:MAG TPA: acetate--CoA ligase family protein [Ignavibacteriales bacterium]|nr:acetate--CoA ligase family protein [Ignavibacteriales bacterium]
MNFQLDSFFYPKSVLVAGASTKEKSIGYELLKTMLSYGYKGEILPVNPKAETILGLKCYHTVEEVDRPVDMAVVLVPKASAEETIDSILQKGVKSIVLITAGFKEVGAEGAKAEKRIVQKIKQSGARLVGPNCMGIINTLDDIKLNATFVAEKPECGSTGFLSQSGALGAAVLNSLRETDIRFAHFISVGNKADINENDILNYWQSNSDIQTLTFYLESFTSGKEFIAPFVRGEITKPAIVLKAGKTSGGMKAASSHTGALGSMDKVVEAVLNQFGIVRVNDLNELFNTAKGFENFPLPNGKKVAVVTNAGGPAILAVDALEKENLVLAELTSETKMKLRQIVHPEGSVENPVDLLPGGSAETYRQVNELLLQDENVDSVISIFVEPVMVQPSNVVEAVSEIKSHKPLFQVYMPLPEFWDYYRHRPCPRIPLFRNPEDPAEVISNMLFYRKRKFRIEKSFPSRLKESGHPGEDRYKFHAGNLLQEEVLKIAEDYNIPVVKSLLLKQEELDTIPENFFPAVLKGVSREVVHKSEFNAVRLNIPSRDSLLKEAKNMAEEFGRKNFTLNSFLIQPYIKVKHEILLGGFRDPSFGPMIMFGTGGKYVEIINDTLIKSAFMSDSDVNEMINKTKIGQIIKGVRGEAPADIRCLREVIKSAARMMIENKRIEEFDINPLVITETNAIYALDIRIKMGE